MSAGGSLAHLPLRPTVLLLVFLAALGTASTASAHERAPEHGGRCDAHLTKSQEVRKTGNVLVWSAPEEEAIHACLRPDGRSIVIGQYEESGEYNSNTETRDFGISGKLVGDVFATGLAGAEECGKYDGSECRSEASFEARVYNLPTGRSIHQSLAGWPAGYAFTSRGAIAWESSTGEEGQSVLEAVRFDPSNMRKGSVETLDTGALGGPLHFTGLTLEWTNAGESKSQALTVAP